MKWTVEGADSSTGKDRVFAVEARDHAEAEVIARQAGLLVSTVRPTPRPPIASVADDPLAALGSAAQATRPHKTVSVPAYRTLGSCIGLLYTVAVFCLIGGVVSAVLAISAVADRNAAATASDEEAELRAEQRMTHALDYVPECVVGGVLMCGCASALGALRDIARNSFK